LEQDLIFTGLAGLADPPRPEVPQAIVKCREAGIRILMLTGDASRTAVAIARQIGLTNDDPQVLEGPAVESLSDQDLQARLLSGSDLIFARMTPRH
jgi:sodium/potassium-transporting ATPase subunit alpha